MTKSSRLIAAAAFAATLCAAGAASAHHAFSMYDNTKYVEITGTVKSYSWRNPHVMIDFIARDEKGVDRMWSVECSSPNIIGRHGWTMNSLKAGDKVPIVIHPMKDGSSAALMVRVTTPSGQVLKDKD